MTAERIAELQESYGLTNAQKLVNNGSIWGFEGSVGRATSDALEAGVLMLGMERTRDYYGTTIPAQTDLKDGTKGTLGNAQRFWTLVDEGDEGATEYAEHFRDFMKF